MNGYVQDERYTAGAWMRRSGACQFCTMFDAGMRRSGVCQFCTMLDAGRSESGGGSKGHGLLFSADYADYADYCMRLAWAMCTTAGMQEVEPRRSSCRGVVPHNLAQYMTHGMIVSNLHRALLSAWAPRYCTPSAMWLLVSLWILQGRALNLD